MAEGNDLCSLMESIRLTNHQTDDERIDLLADALREKLGVDMNKSAYKQLAMQFQQLHLEQNLPGRYSAETKAETPNRDARGSFDNRTASPVVPLTPRQPSSIDGVFNMANGIVRSPFKASTKSNSNGSTENLQSKSPSCISGKQHNVSPFTTSGLYGKQNVGDEFTAMSLGRRSRLMGMPRRLMLFFQKPTCESMTFPWLPTA